MTCANNIARRRTNIVRSAAKKKTKPSPPVFGRPYGIFRVIDGGAADRAPALISAELLHLIEELRVKAKLAINAGDLIEKYRDGAGKSHPCRTADFNLWRERQEHWDAAAEAVAAFRSRNYHEVRMKAEAFASDMNNIVGVSVIKDVLRLTGCLA
jgi:hypothetical protein